MFVNLRVQVPYRLKLDYPTPSQYAEIFRKYCDKLGVEVPDGLIDRVLARYQAESRPLRSCEPRDLLQRANDICRYQGVPFQLSEKVLGLAWDGYFGGVQGGERDYSTRKTWFSAPKLSPPASMVTVAWPLTDMLPTTNWAWYTDPPP